MLFLLMMMVEHIVAKSYFWCQKGGVAAMVCIKKSDAEKMRSLIIFNL